MLNNLKKFQVQGYTNRCTANHVGGAFPLSYNLIYTLGKCQKVTIGWIGWFSSRKKIPSHLCSQNVFSLHIGKGLQINNLLDFSMKLLSLCLSYSELCRRLPVLNPLCISFFLRRFQCMLKTRNIMETFSP